MRRVSRRMLLGLAAAVVFQALAASASLAATGGSTSSDDPSTVWLFLLVPLAVAGALVALTVYTRGGRRTAYGYALDNSPRRRREVRPWVITVLRPLFVYNHHRHAYVLRVIGNRRGPVLRSRAVVPPRSEVAQDGDGTVPAPRRTGRFDRTGREPIERATRRETVELVPADELDRRPRAPVGAREARPAKEPTTPASGGERPPAREPSGREDPREEPPAGETPGGATPDRPETPELAEAVGEAPRNVGKGQNGKGSKQSRAENPAPHGRPDGFEAARQPGGSRGPKPKRDKSAKAGKSRPKQGGGRS